MAATAIFGCTGLVGAHILTTALASDTFGVVQTISRRAPKAEGPKLQATIEADTSQWATKLAALSPTPSTVFAAVGTTRAQAGGIQPQWKIDHDLNVELAQAAKKVGTRTYVFISSAGTRGMLSSSVPYSKMKQGVEDSIKALDFEQAIILRPGAILGEREVPHVGGGALNAVIRGLGRFISQGAQDMLGQDAEVIARAAVHAAKLANEGKAPAKYWVIECADIVRLGRTEWLS
ncbi:NAD(P)-binding protein [Thozetella sp. PMI_491]|nr:NAD(P)-binding protein [Thozetella sp. PMI_491]